MLARLVGGQRRCPPAAPPSPTHSSANAHPLIIPPGRLAAVGVVDVLPRCLSAKYLFWDPALGGLGLGRWTALREIGWVRAAADSAAAAAVPLAHSLRWYFMGYYIHACPKMRYKAEFAPSELLCNRRARDWGGCGGARRVPALGLAGQGGTAPPHPQPTPPPIPYPRPPLPTTPAGRGRGGPQAQAAPRVFARLFRRRHDGPKHPLEHQAAPPGVLAVPGPAGGAVLAQDAGLQVPQPRAAHGQRVPAVGRATGQELKQVDVAHRLVVGVGLVALALGVGLDLAGQAVQLQGWGGQEE